MRSRETRGERQQCVRAKFLIAPARRVGSGGERVAHRERLFEIRRIARTESRAFNTLEPEVRCGVGIGDGALFLERAREESPRRPKSAREEAGVETVPHHIPES